MNDIPRGKLRRSAIGSKTAVQVGGIAVAIVILFVAVNLFNGPATQPAEVAETSIGKPEPGKDETLPEKNTDMEIQPDQVELVEMLSSDQQLDLFENLEFYAWLAEDENISG